MTEQHVTLIDGSATLPVTDSTEQPRSQEAALREAELRLTAVEHVLASLDTDRDRELVRIALTRPRRVLPHVHTPTSKPGDANAYCSTCGFFPLPLAATPPERPVAPEWLSQALNEGDGTYKP